MYTLAGPLDDIDVAPGSNILVLGPAMSGKQRFAYQVVADGTIAGDGGIIISTSDGAEHVRRTYESMLGDEEPDGPLGIIDCVSNQQGGEEADDGDRVKYASSPVDMTGIGIDLSELLEEFHDVHGLDRNRVVLDNISTMLMYSNVQTIFRFLHVFTGRVQNVDGLGLYLMDPSAHDAQTINTLKGLFDGMVETSDEDDSLTYTGVQG